MEAPAGASLSLASHDGVHLRAIKTMYFKAPASPGSPTSSTSCKEAQCGFVSTADSPIDIGTHHVATGFMPYSRQEEKPLPIRRRHSRKPARRQAPMVSHQATQKAALTSTQVARELQKTTTLEAVPGGRGKRAPKPKKMWNEVDIFEPSRLSKRDTSKINVAPAAPSLECVQASVVPQAGPEIRPVPDDAAPAALTSIACAPKRPCHKALVLDPDFVEDDEEDEDDEDEEEKAAPGKPLKKGGPCYVCCLTESKAWRLGVEAGLFPSKTLCNSHGTLDRRGRLWKYVDAEGIKDLHASDMSNEEKAAACTSCYVKGRAVARSPRKASKQKKGQEIDAAVLRVGGRARANGKGKTVPFYDTEEVLCGQEQVGRAGANEPWMMQSPGPVRQATQATRRFLSRMDIDLVAPPQPTTGRGKRRRADYDDDYTANIAEAPSKKRLCFAEEQGAARAAAARRVSKHGSEEEDVLHQDKVIAMGDELEEQLSGVCADQGMVSALAGLLTMRRSSSSDMDVFMMDT